MFLNIAGLCLMAAFFSDGANGAVPGQAAPAPVPAVLPAVVARVNGEDVRKEDLEAMILLGGQALQEIPPYSRDAVVRETLDQLVVTTLLSQESKARGIEIDDAEIAAMLQRPTKLVMIEAGVSSRDGRRQPARQKSTDEAQQRALTMVDVLRDHRGLVKRMLSAQKLIEVEVAAPVATDADLREFYAKYADMFKEEETVRSNHIFIEVDPQAAAGVRAKAKARIDTLLKRIHAGEDFDRLARKYSEDADARGGGDENYVSRDQWGAQLGPAVFAMKPGEISRVLTADAGYYVFKVTDRKPARVVPFEEAVPNIKDMLQGLKLDRLPALLERLKAKATIEVLI